MLLCIHFTLIQRFNFSDFIMILTSVPSWLRNPLEAPKIMSFSRIRKLRALLWTGLSACAPPRPISKQTRVPKRHTPHGCVANWRDQKKLGYRISCSYPVLLSRAPSVLLRRGSCVMENVSNPKEPGATFSARGHIFTDFSTQNHSKSTELNSRGNSTAIQHKYRKNQQTIPKKNAPPFPVMGV